MTLFGWNKRWERTRQSWQRRIFRPQVEPLEDRLTPASPLSVQGVNVMAFERSAFSGTVATFTDPNPGAAVGNYTATIAWGDGSVTTGTVAAGSSGSFTVSGSHTFLDEGAFTPAVTISSVTGAVGTVSTSATVLEELLPDGTRGDANERFVSELYRDLLGRQVDPTGLSLFGGALDAGRASPTGVVEAIETSRSNEYQTRQVDALYQLYLNRAPDPTGLSNALTAMAHGVAPEGIAASIVSSPEFIGVRGGGSTTGALNALYQLALGRPIDATGLNNALTALAGGRSLRDVAGGVFASHEYHADLVASFSTQFLDHPPDSLAAFFVRELDQRTSDNAVLAQLLGDFGARFFDKTAR
jgi:hypothetical protein